MRILYTLPILLCITAIAAGDRVDDMDTATFLAHVRQPRLQKSWGIFKGTVHYLEGHKPKGKLPVELRARFSPERITAQVIFNDQWYLVGQDFRDGIAGTSVVEQKAPVPGAITMADRGLRPSDLTLSFLYWDFVEELPTDKVANHRCRVLRLRHPEAKETVVVWVSHDYLFPMAVEWFAEHQEEPYRRLAFKDPKKVGDVYVIKRIFISNTGWRTKVVFKDIKLAETENEPIPDDLFRTLE